MATISSFNTSSSDGYLKKFSSVYATAHDAAVAGDKDNSGSQLRIGQRYISPNYYIYRSFLYIDTSTIPDDAIIISAKLSLFLDTDIASAATAFNIVIRRNSAGTYPSDPLVTSDFDYTFYTSDGGSLNTDNVSGTWSDIFLNSTGLGWINKTGTTKLALISSRDINAVVPSGNEYAIFRSQESTSSQTPPKLTITYAVESYPTATTQAATNVKDVSCKGSGTLTDGLLATEYGFEYGLTKTPTWKISRTENIAEGSFSLNINGLEPKTTYYYRAYATNSYGTAYGNWVSFTTDTLFEEYTLTYGIYEESNTATICFYVRRAGGKWSIKHGPYTKDQADIEIGKILTEGKGKYQIKFTSDVLTGLSVSIMTKMDIKAR